MLVDFTYIVLAAFIYLIILISLSTCIRVMPYSRDKIFSIDFPYEGFNSINDPPVSEENTHITTCGYNSEQPECGYKKEECVKLHGFDELYCQPTHKPKYFDKFMGTETGTNGNRFGLSTSKGALALSQEQISLLATRGGNSVDKPGEVGK